MILVYITLGGAAGSILRYLAGGAVQRASQSGFPIGTLTVNVVGCFIVGVLIRLQMNLEPAPWARGLLVIGFCGGFTTFSMFSAETVALIEGGEYLRASGYMLLSVVLCVMATFAGLALARVAGGRTPG